MAKANPEGMKWPTDKPRYDKNYLRLYGKICPTCKGKNKNVCSRCMGLGRVEK
jgi:hypothetical protein